MLPGNISNLDYTAPPTAQNLKTAKNVNRINWHDASHEGEQYILQHKKSVNVYSKAVKMANV